MMGESFGLASDDGRDPGVQEHQRVQLRATNWLAGLVARVPVPIRTKLLVSLAVMVVVAVVSVGRGLRVLGESNARFGALATLQRKAATYRALQNQNSQLRSMVQARTNPMDFQSQFPGLLAPSDESVESTL